MRIACPTCRARVDISTAVYNVESYGTKHCTVACHKCGSGVGFDAERTVRIRDIAPYNGKRDRDDWGEDMKPIAGKPAAKNRQK